MKLLLLYGGNSNEHDVSCLSIKNIVNNIDEDIFTYIICYIDSSNNWTVVNKSYKKIRKVKNIIKFIKEFDCIFNIIHGNDGEDGKLQSLFELCNVKYVGCNYSSSMLCMDKILTKLVLKENGIPTTPTYKIEELTLKDYPIIVKPSNSGSSIGVSKVNNLEELPKALEEAYKYDKQILIEKFIEGRELECSAIEINDKIYISSVGEIKSSNELYDYDAKYINDSKLIIPSKLDLKTVIKIKKYAEEAFKVLGCKGFARIDFFYDDDIYLNEVNTLPGFTNISMFSKLLNYDDIETKDIINILIHNAIKDE